MNYFLDVGANQGRELVKFMRQYPDFHFLAIEPQPGMVAEIQQRVQTECPQIPCEYFSMAAWVTEGTIPIYLATCWGGNYKSGSTIIPGMQNYATPDYAHGVQVPCVDFSAWVQRRVSRADTVICKMDIEGAEYEVLEKMVADQTISLFDALLIEWHVRMRPDISRDRHVALTRRIAAEVQVSLWK